VQETVSPTPEDIITDVLRDKIAPDLLADLRADLPRLSSEDLASRLSKLRRSRSLDRIRAGVVELLTELELYRTGYDEGYEDGYHKAIDDMLEWVGVASGIHAPLLEIAQRYEDG
jgi:hypothetical protein